MKFSPSHHLTTIQHMAHSKNCENFALISVSYNNVDVVWFTMRSVASPLLLTTCLCPVVDDGQKKKKGVKKVRKEIAWENLKRLLKLPTDLNEMLRKTEMRKLRKTQKQFSFRVWVLLWEDHASVERIGKVRKTSTFSTRLFRFLSTTDKPCECDENSSLAPILCKMCVRD